MGQNNIKKSPNLWCSEYGLKVVSLEKQWTEKAFNEEKVGLEEFLNKISQCVLIPPDDKTRKGAWALKKKLIKNLN